MKHLCAWCEKELRPDTPGDEHIVSHGICETCKAALQAQAKQLAAAIAADVMEKAEAVEQ